MRKLLMVYNPASGDARFREELDEWVRGFQSAGYLVSLLRTEADGSTCERVGEALSLGGFGEADAVVAAGGDGTLNRVANALVRCGCRAPLAVIPAGTANDFARFIGAPGDVAAACKALAARNVVCADIGAVNGLHHFVNVCAAGMLTNISHYIDQDLKNSLGKLAYYIKGLEQIPNFVPLRFKITTAAEVFEEELYFFFILNSSGAGGFDKLSPGAKLDDGLFDFVGFRAFPIFELPALFLKVLAGDCLDDRRILFVRDSFFRVEYLSPPGDKMMMITDIDGEPGPQFPIEVHNMARHLPILTT